MKARKFISVAAGLFGATLACHSALAQGKPVSAGAQATAGATESGGKGEGRWGALKAQLSEEQISQLKALREQLQAGDITRDEFKQKAQAIVGDIQLPPAGGACGHRGAKRHGGPGEGFGPGGEMPMHQLAARLGLSDVQKTQAKGIFKTAGADVKALRDAALQSARALLTSDQQAIVDQFLAKHAPSAQVDAAGTAGSARALGRPTQGQATTDGPARRHVRRGPSAGAGEHKRMGPMGAGPLLPPPVMAKLNLTDEQKASLKTVREGIQASAKARLDQAKSDLRAILTTEQATKLDELKAQRPQPGRFHHAGPGELAPAGA